MKYTLEGLLQKNESYKDMHLVWTYFFELSKIPRPSKHEKQVREWVLMHAKKWNRQVRVDDFGNIVLEISATSQAFAHLPKLAIQSHLDMVCEKDSHVEHDFFKDALRLEIISADFKAETVQWLSAQGTTLGADDGIAVAMAMALADPTSSVEHGPLQLLFTLDEETGLNGAANLGSEMINAPFFINIDNAQEKVLCIGCAGGRDFIAKMPICRVPLKSVNGDQNNTVYTLSVDNLSGGHSGMEIFDGRGSAIKTLERAISLIKKYNPDFALINFFGGDKRNAIPRFAQATVCINETDEQDIKKRLEKLQAVQRQALPSIDKKLSISLEKGIKMQADFSGAFSDKSLETLLSVIRLSPHGVIFRRGLGPDDPSLSNNLASIRTEDTYISIVNNSRFSFALEEDYVENLFESIYKNSDADINTENSYCSWEAEKKSKLQEIYTDVHEDLFGEKPTIKVVHAGLECGLIKNRTAAVLDAISVGPEIQFLHSPKERLHIESTQRMWKLLTALCTRI